MGFRLTGLWRHPDFTKLWVAQTVSSLGTGITGQALPFTALLVLGASAGDMGLLAAASQVPVVLVILFAGVWADRLRRRPILIAADVGRAALLVTIPVAAVLGVLSMGQLFAVAMLVEALSLFFSVAYRSYLPTLIPREQLVDGNSKLSAGGSVAEISGPAVGGVLVQWLTAPFALLFDAASFLVSALFLGAIRTSEPPPAPPDERKSVRMEIVEGLQVVLRNRVLRALAACSGTFTFFGNFFHALYVLYAVRDQGIPPGIVGVLVGAGGAGALVGAVLVGPVTRRFGVGPTLICSLTFSALVGLPIVLVDGPLPFTIAVFFVAQLAGDITIAIYLINDMSLRQAMVPDRLLGRANASMGFLVGGLGPVGALVGGALGELIGARYTLAIAIIAISLAPLWLFFSPARTLREAPVIAEPAG
ncbi:MAG: MFS transporter [Chloroflexota bacterium]|nr:MFS transporter [Chloroflexota bacterium]MDQ5867660.1 MFS transporter [Chloroflexota bacterium]